MNRFLVYTLTLALACVVSTSPSFAQDSAKKAKEPYLPAPIQNIVAQGAQIRYLGRELGLDGWVTIQNGQEQYFYVTPDGQGILLGILFNNKGDAITLQQINTLRGNEGPAIDRLAGYIPPVENQESEKAASSPTTADFKNPQDILKSATKTKSERLYEGVEAANWIALGDQAAPPVYVFIDPECPHCHDLINDYRNSGMIEKSLVQLRLIPVGVLSEQSLQEAAYLLASPNAQKDLYDHLDGKPDALLVNRNANTQGVQRNMQLMQDWKLDVTPFSVYKDRDGKVKILQGRPKDLKSLITELR